MNVYQASFTLKPGTDDMAFVEALHAWLDHLGGHGLIAGYRVLRRKLGLAPEAWGEFQVLIEVRDLAQLDAAFSRVAAREDPEEELHHAVNSRVASVTFGLFRDFPDPQRTRGRERF